MTAAMTQVPVPTATEKGFFFRKYWLTEGLTGLTPCDALKVDISCEFNELIKGILLLCGTSKYTGLTEGL